MQASPPATRQETVRFAFNSSLPIFFGYVILGTGYGLYMHNLGFGFWFPTIMAAVVYGGSVEFILASMLVQSFLPGNVVLITLVVGLSTVLLWPFNAEKVSWCGLAQVLFDLWLDR